MLTSPTIHVSVLGASMLASLHARRLDKPLSPRDRFGMFVMLAAIAVALSAALVWADAQPRPAPAPPRTTQFQPRV